MAVITPTFAGARPTDQIGESAVITWANLTTGDTGDPVDYRAYTDRAVQVTGTFGGATVTIEGTIDGTNYATLTDPQGNALSITAAKIEQVAETVVKIRPAVTGGSGTSVTVSLLAHRGGFR